MRVLVRLVVAAQGGHRQVGEPAVQLYLYPVPAALFLPVHISHDGVRQVPVAIEEGLNRLRQVRRLLGIAPLEVV